MFCVRSNTSLIPNPITSLIPNPITSLILNPNTSLVSLERRESLEAHCSQNDLSLHCHKTPCEKSKRTYIVKVFK